MMLAKRLSYFICDEKHSVTTQQLFYSNVSILSIISASLILATLIPLAHAGDRFQQMVDLSVAKKAKDSTRLLGIFQNQTKAEYNKTFDGHEWYC